MRNIHRIGRLARTLAALAASILAVAAAMPAALAVATPPSSGSAAAQAHPMVVGGMPGWQITLIAIGAAAAGAAAAVVLDRVRAARRHAPAPTS